MIPERIPEEIIKKYLGTDPEGIAGYILKKESLKESSEKFLKKSFHLPRVSGQILEVKPSEIAEVNPGRNPGRDLRKRPFEYLVKFLKEFQGFPKRIIERGPKGIIVGFPGETLAGNLKGISRNH